jgi:sugar phosphate isomerase/epimerase
MPTGIFTFYIPGTVDETARRIRAYGFDTVQLNLEFKDWRFQDDSSPAACQAVRETFHGNGLSIAAIAGYLNPIARDPARRRANLDRMKAMLERAGDLGSPYVATETGSLHPLDDWAPHPDNETLAAFDQTCGRGRACASCRRLRCRAVAGAVGGQRRGYVGQGAGAHGADRQSGARPGCRSRQLCR